MGRSIKNFAKNLRLCRNYMRLTQEEMAEKLGLTYSFYTKIESHNNFPGFDTAIKICDILDVPMEFFLKEEGWKLYTIYANSYILEKLKEMPDNKFKLLSDVLAFIYEEMLKDTKPDE